MLKAISHNIKLSSIPSATQNIRITICYTLLYSPIYQIKMNGKPENYDKLSPKELTQYVEMTVDHYFKKMSWSDDDIILDIGSGTGCKTKNILLAKCPKLQQIIGIDIDPIFTDYARQNHSDVKITYKIQNIVERIDIDDIEKYDKVVCFYATHYIRDFDKLASNVSAMLKPGGYFLFVSVINSPLLSQRSVINSCEDWKKYVEMEDIISAEPLTINWTDVDTKFKAILSDCDLFIKDSKLEKLDIPFLNKDNLIDFYLTTSPKSLFSKLDDGFINSLREKLPSVFLKQGAREENGKYFIPHQLYTCYGQKED